MAASRHCRPDGHTLVAALFAADVSLRLRRVAVVVTIGAVVAELSLVGLGHTGEGAAGLLNAALIALAPFAIARSVVRRRIIDARTVLAALRIFVLLGMTWAFVYTTIGAFSSSPFFAQTATATSADYLYFSFSHQSHGRLRRPQRRRNAGRACAVLEALIGQLYLVTIVALVVSRSAPPRP